MTDLPFFQVDAFADRPLAGNPAAVMPLERWLDDAVLQAIAAENNLSETAFTVGSKGGVDDDGADYALRWFTPLTEVALCGHATLAAGHILLGERQAVRFSTRRSGILGVARDGDGYRLSLPAIATAEKPLPEIVEAMGQTPPQETRWNGLGYALLVYSNADVVRQLQPDFGALRAMPGYLIIATATGDGGADIVSRVFAPAAGVDEDPVTGSAHAALAPYWLGRLGRDTLIAEQASTRGGRIGCRLNGDRVLLSGRCITVIEGRFRLD